MLKRCAWCERTFGCQPVSTRGHRHHGPGRTNPWFCSAFCRQRARLPRSGPRHPPIITQVPWRDPSPNELGTARAAAERMP
jgi:hypothetical protein